MSSVWGAGSVLRVPMDSHHVFLKEPDGRSQRKFWEREP